MPIWWRYGPVLQFEGGARTKDRGQSGEECRKRKLHRKRELCNNYNSHLLKHFDVFEKHNLMTVATFRLREWQ